MSPRIQWLCAMVAVVIGVSAAQAQTEPHRPTRPYGDEFNVALYPVAPYYGEVEDYPAAEVRAVPAAAAAATATEWEAVRAYRNLNRAVGDKVRTFNRSEEYRQAIQEEREAYAAYEQARAAALAPLADDPDYQAQQHLQQRLRETILDQHDQASPAMDEIRAAAALRLSQLQAARARENELLQQDSNVAQTLERARAAHQRVLALRDERAEAVRNDPELETMRQLVWDWRIARLVAAEYLDRAIEAREIALDYAYFLQRPQSKVAHTYEFPSGYPIYGPIGPYWD